MASVWIERYARKGAAGGFSYRVRYVLGGRESVPQWGGAFPTKREADARKQWIRDELAAMRVPQLALVAPTSPTKLREVAERWRESRIDVAAGTAQAHRVNLTRIIGEIGDRPADAITAAAVAAFVATLHERGLARESIRKTLATLAMVLDHAGRQPNPARDKVAVRLPREDRAEVAPPTAGHVLAVHALMPSRYRLPLLVLDALGLRVGELEALKWGDIDELEGRFRVSQAVAKTRQARWVPVEPVALLAAVSDLVPREDRHVDRQVFEGFGADRFRTSLAKACKAAGVPLFSPHDLRHRRATLWHLGGIPPVQAAAWLGHSPVEHLRTYAHATLVDRSELDHARLVHQPVHTPAAAHSD